MSDEGTMSVEIAMQWTTAYSSSVHTFANTINTTEGGMHEEGADLLVNYGREKGIIRDKDDNSPATTSVAKPTAVSFNQAHRTPVARRRPSSQH